LAACAAIGLAAEPAGTTKTIQTTLKLRTGGSITGPVADYDEYAVVVVAEDKPYAVAWMELEPGSAIEAMRALLSFRRGGEKMLTAEDHFQLGKLGLQHGRRGLATDEFREAERLDRTMAGRVRVVLERHTQEPGGREAEGLTTEPLESVDRKDNSAVGWSIPLDAEPSSSPTVARRPSPEHGEQVLSAYRQYGAKVQEVLGRDITLVESEHFLIWTDWEPRYRKRLGEWLESAYAALCRQFELDPAENVFLAKCPVFCFKARGKFQRFGRDFDGYDARDATGYTRSIESNGHVHVVLLRQGRTPVDFDRFAWTLVHESTHAFVHRLHSSRLIPHWVNEGLAEWTAEAVLGDRCPAKEVASLASRVLVRHDVPTRPLLESAAPIEVHEYPIAHSTVAYLLFSDSTRFRGFLKSLKSGDEVGAALSASYEGLTIDQLESRWRQAVRESESASNSSGDERGLLPWFRRL
jgi:hypothetical protein